MSDVSVYDLAPSTQQFLTEVVRGLEKSEKTIPSKFFYDKRGSQIFDEICELDEYYLTRTELDIMEQSVSQMVSCIGPETVLVEYGSGSSLKTQLLLDEFTDLAGYVPVDISQQHLEQTVEQLVSRYPELPVFPVCADFTQIFELPEIESSHRRVVCYFPGSTIGNFSPKNAIRLMRQIAELCGPDGGLLIGVDLKKHRSILEPAYSDSQGVTREFNLNLLRRVNRELDADFDVDNFQHHAIYNEKEGRMESHLVSLQDQTVCVGETEFDFPLGESIHTENSYKYDLDEFREYAELAGFGVEHVWTDEQDLFSVQYLHVH